MTQPRDDEDELPTQEHGPLGDEDGQEFEIVKEAPDNDTAATE